GGTAPYDLSGAITATDVTTGYTESGLAAGTYNVTVTDSNGCTATTSVTITEPTLLEIDSISDITDVSCNNPSVGAIDISVTGGVAPYSYAWTTTDGMLPSGQESVEAPSGLTAGTYAVVITDSNGCIVENSYIVREACLEFIKTSAVADGGDGRVDVGDTIRYTFTVTNTGNVTVDGIVINDTQIGVTDLVLVPSSLAPGAEGIASVVYTITQDDIDAGSVSNSAIASGVDSSGIPVEDTSDSDDPTEPGPDDPTVTSLTPKGNIALEKTGTFNDVNGNGYADVGETITYAFTVANTGNVSLSNITITDALVTVNGGPIATLAPGEVDSTTFTALYTITEEDINNESVTNTAIATGTDPQGTTITDTSDDPNNSTNDDPDGDGDPEDPTVTVVPPFGSLGVEATKYATVVDVNNDGIIGEGDSIDYTITVENTGQVTLLNITLEDIITNGAGTELQLTTGITFEGASLNSSEGTLQVNEVATYVASYEITEDDAISRTVENTVNVTAVDTNGKTTTDVSDNGDDTDGNTTDDPTSVDVEYIDPAPPVSAIKVTKQATFTDNGDGKPSEGDIIDYTIIVYNTGEVALSNVTITDVLTDGNNEPLTLTLEPTFNKASLGSSEGVLKVTESAEYLASYTITQSDVNSKYISNTVEARALDTVGETVSDVSDDGDDTDGNTEDDPTVTSLDGTASISLLKEAVFNDENGDGYASVGETINYLFTITNTGDVDLYNITLEDQLDGIEISGNVIATLGVNETDNTTFSASYTITQTDLDNGVVENQARVTGEDAQGNEVSDYSDDPNNPTDNDVNNDGNPDDRTNVSLNPENCEVVVYDIVSPDGDGIADYLTIDGLDCYPDNTVEIYNRWGIRVFQTQGYGATGEVFRGYSDGRVTIQRNKKLPTGTYYYVLNYINEAGVNVRKAGPIFVITD
ncbi:DUF7507 domain-containing protein, partial [Joostella sp. CR20]|uniref:DUF7507 domain-containing protein n=1 Tax=Joostella sp. CR20 TaxID=2804312 RepID=UPI00313AEEFF